VCVGVNSPFSFCSFASRWYEAHLNDAIKASKCSKSHRGGAAPRKQSRLVNRPGHVFIVLEHLCVIWLWWCGENGFREIKSQAVHYFLLFSSLVCSRRNSQWHKLLPLSVSYCEKMGRWGADGNIKEWFKCTFTHTIRMAVSEANILQKVLGEKSFFKGQKYQQISTPVFLYSFCGGAPLWVHLEASDCG